MVAAIDRIESRFSAFLTSRPLPAITEELARLADTARQYLGAALLDVEVEPSMLLRRQIARRCVYGLDINPIAVELARLAIWIHTFVPGLPMSSLDHNLVQGNSLTGIGTVDEVFDILEPQRTPGQYSVFAAGIEEALAAAKTHLMRVARTAEATKQEVRDAASAYAKAKAEADGARILFDAAVGVRLGLAPLPNWPDQAAEIGQRADVQAAVAETEAAHLPYLFPEVFLRDNPGFDVLLGNPPWEEATVEKLKFWTVHNPGLNGMPQQEQAARIKKLERTRPDLVRDYERRVAEANAMRAVLLRGPYPGMGTGDPDLYKAFTWRIWQTLRVDGAAGIVLPRSALAAKGSAPWREAVIAGGAFCDVTLLANNRTWVFDDLDPRYTIGLVTLRKGEGHVGWITMRGPFASMDEYRRRVGKSSVRVSVSDFATWSDTAAFPAIPDAAALAIFTKMRQHPPLGATGVGPWRARPATEFHATSDKKHFSLDLSQRRGWPVYKGASFDIWHPDTGTYYGWADPDYVTDVLQQRRLRQARNQRSPFSEFDRSVIDDPSTLPCRNPRIMFRDIARADDTRTIRAALAPPNVVATNKAPYLLFPVGTARDEAYVLGVLCSIPLDWIARTVVEITVNFHIINGLPVPRPAAGSPLATRVINISGRLAAVDHRYSDWAAKVGVPVSSVTSDDERDDLIAELDAVVALLYGLTADEVTHLFATFHRGWDYQPRLERVLRHYATWAARA